LSTGTNLFVPSLRARKLSAAVGSGKTRAATAWIASPDNSTRNVLYVAPTQALIEQTARDIRAALSLAGSGRNVHLIHADNVVRGQVKAEVLKALAQVEEDAGLVLLITTHTFLEVVSQAARPERWTVILDEAFQPATFESFPLGADALKGWEHFCELFTVDPEQGHRILPREGKLGLVREVGAGSFGNAGGRFIGLEKTARAVANPAIRCELVLTDGARDILAGAAPKKRPGSSDGGTTLQFASYVDPSAFAGFASVLFLSALFEETILFHLWTKALGVVFEEHPEFPSHLLRRVHEEQGRMLAVGYLLNREDRPSLDSLSRNALTGQPGGAPGGRVIDHLIRTAAEHFGDEPFLLQSNERYGYTDGAPRTPRMARCIPTISHGMNSYQGVDNVAALALTNPAPQQIAWIQSRTGMSKRAITQAYRISTTYQALGRCSIRCKERAEAPKVALVVGEEDARFIHELFPGSHWLGQAGSMPSLSALRQREAGEQLGKVDSLAIAITRHLDSIPAGVDKIGSKTLRMEVEGVLRRHQHLKGGVGGEVEISPTSWTRAVAQACLIGQRWRKQGQSLRRVTAELYGFPACP